MGNQGISIETGEGKIHTLVWGWGAVILGIGITVSAIILSSYLGLAITILAGCTGAGIFCVGVGEGIKRVKQGHAAELAARAQLEDRRRKELPWLD